MFRSLISFLSHWGLSPEYSLQSHTPGSVLLDGMNRDVICVVIYLRDYKPGGIPAHDNDFDKVVSINKYTLTGHNESKHFSATDYLLTRWSAEHSLLHWTFSWQKFINTISKHRRFGSSKSISGNFHGLSRPLFIFPSRYLFAIGHRAIFRFTRSSPRIFTQYSQIALLV